VLDNIRAEIWLKLWGNLTFNPISALTHGTLEGICRYPLTRQLARDMMTEAQTVSSSMSRPGLGAPAILSCCVVLGALLRRLGSSCRRGG
jgi:ketopantoate reductase